MYIIENDYESYDTALTNLSIYDYIDLNLSQVEFDLDAEDGILICCDSIDAANLC